MIAVDMGPILLHCLCQLAGFGIEFNLGIQHAITLKTNKSTHHSTLIMKSPQKHLTKTSLPITPRPRKTQPPHKLIPSTPPHRICLTPMQRHYPIIHQNPHQRLPFRRTLHHLDIRARRKRDSPRSRVPICLCGGLGAVLREWLRTIV